MNIKILLLTIRAILKFKYWIDPRIIYAQFWHETGGFTSAIFLENKNVCGMKVNSRNYEKGENRGHAFYTSLWDSVQDFFARQIQFKVEPSNDIEVYLDRTQKSRYAEDKKYIERVVNVFETVKSRLNTFFLVGTPLVIGIPLGIAIYLYKRK